MKLSSTATLLVIVASAWAQQSPVQTPNPATDEVQNFSLEANSFIDALLKSPLNSSSRWVWSR